MKGGGSADSSAAEPKLVDNRTGRDEDGGRSDNFGKGSSPILCAEA